MGTPKVSDAPALFPAVGIFKKITPGHVCSQQGMLGRAGESGLEAARVFVLQRLRMVAWRRTDFWGLRSNPVIPTLGNGPEGNVREGRNRPQGRYQFSRGDPSGSLVF